MAADILPTAVKGADFPVTRAATADIAFL
jgi:hypothetical protein